MYGIVNKAIEELVCANFGEDVWETIKLKSEIDIDYFISNEPYDDEITYKLAGTISQELNLTITQVLITFGEWWVLKTGKEKYGSLMSAGGNNLREFLINLPAFHSRVMLMYPKLSPPEFQISDIEEKSINIHYLSHRPGLHDFVKGLLLGLGKMYDVSVSVEQVYHHDSDLLKGIYKVSW